MDFIIKRNKSNFLFKSQILIFKIAMVGKGFERRRRERAGRQKIEAIEAQAAQLIRERGELFSESFERNIQVLDELGTVKSKRTRDILASCIARELRKVKKSGI